MNSKVEAALLITVLVTVIGGLYGWIINIVHLVNDPFEGGMSIARAIGVIVAPLGAVLGYC